MNEYLKLTDRLVDTGACRNQCDDSRHALESFQDETIAMTLIDCTDIQKLHSELS